jgi:hypothetical protein
VIPLRHCNPFDSPYPLIGAGLVSAAVAAEDERKEKTMSGSVNRVILVGNLGRDPEIRSTQGGKIVDLAVATSESWRE